MNCSRRRVADLMPPVNSSRPFLKAGPHERAHARARGAALSAGDMLHILVTLCRDEDPAIASLSRETLSTWTEAELAAQLRDSSCPQTVLEHFARRARQLRARSSDLQPRHPIARSWQSPAKCPPPLLESLLDNRVRLLESPAF